MTGMYQEIHSRVSSERRARKKVRVLQRFNLLSMRLRNLAAEKLFYGDRFFIARPPRWRPSTSVHVMIPRVSPAGNDAVEILLSPISPETFGVYRFTGPGATFSIACTSHRSLQRPNPRESMPKKNKYKEKWGAKALLSAQFKRKIIFWPPFLMLFKIIQKYRYFVSLVA